MSLSLLGIDLKYFTVPAAAAAAAAVFAWSVCAPACVSLGMCISWFLFDRELLVLSSGFVVWLTAVSR